MLALTNGVDQKKKAASQVKSGLFEIWLHRVDEFRNCFLYENVFETNLQFQAVELAIARMQARFAHSVTLSDPIIGRNG